MKLRTLAGAAALALLSATSASAHGQNLLTSANNPSFESPDVSFVGLSAPPWVLDGPQTLQDIPPFGLVPVIAGTGIFENPADPDPSRLANADGSQIAYIFANSFADVITGQVKDHSFTQVLTGTTYQSGQKYELRVDVANATSVPPADSVLTLALFSHDPTNAVADQILSSIPITAAQLNGETLDPFSTTTDAIAGAAIGKEIGVRISTHTAPATPSLTGQFDFDNVRVTIVPEPTGAAALLCGGLLAAGLRRRNRQVR
jgi:hypothetical protein